MNDALLAVVFLTCLALAGLLAHPLDWWFRWLDRWRGLS